MNIIINIGFELIMMWIWLCDITQGSHACQSCHFGSYGSGITRIIDLCRRAKLLYTQRRMLLSNEKAGQTCGT